MSAIEPKKCVAKKGGYLESACEAMQNAVQHHPTKKSKGLFSSSILNFVTGESPGTMVTLHSGDFVGDGVLLNYCPFCGSRMHDRFDGEKS